MDIEEACAIVPPYRGDTMTKEEAVSLATARLDDQDRFKNQTVHARRIDRDHFRDSLAKHGETLNKLRPLIEKKLGMAIPPCDENNVVPGWLVSFPILRHEDAIVTLCFIYIEVHDDGTVQEMGTV